MLTLYSFTYIWVREIFSSSIRAQLTVSDTISLALVHVQIKFDLSHEARALLNERESQCAANFFSRANTCELSVLLMLARFRTLGMVSKERKRDTRTHTEVKNILVHELRTTLKAQAPSKSRTLHRISLTHSLYLNPSLTPAQPSPPPFNRFSSLLPQESSSRLHEYACVCMSFRTRIRKSRFTYLIPTLIRTQRSVCVRMWVFVFRIHSVSLSVSLYRYLSLFRSTLSFCASLHVPHTTHSIEAHFVAFRVLTWTEHAHMKCTCIKVGTSRKKENETQCNLRRASNASTNAMHTLIQTFWYTRYRASFSTSGFFHPPIQPRLVCV